MILKKGIQVKVITGKDKGKTGEILEIDRKLNKIKVDKHQPTHQKTILQAKTVIT